jgi:hypothetical protein
VRRGLAALALLGGLATAPLATAAAGPAPAETPPLGYELAPRPETAAVRAARHEQVAARRAQPALIICHRGAAAFAPENTLEAYAAAMDYGADGCEVDVRRTLDGVLVLFHDDMLDQLTDGFGTVDRLTYAELVALRPRQVYGTATARTRPPTFAALLTLARRRAMLLHLDVKEPGLDDALADLLTEADAWDHVIAVNATTAPRLARDPRARVARFKGPGLYEKRLDVDPEAVRRQLALPGQAVMVDDPRVAARELGRPAYLPAPMPDLRAPPPATPPPADGDDPFRRMRTLARYVGPETGPQVCATCAFRQERALPRLYRGAADVVERAHPDPELREGEASDNPDALFAPVTRSRTERILHRAMVASAWARRGRLPAGVRAWLEFEVRHRSLHRDWMFHGLDGAMAARALGDLGVTEAAPVLVQAFRRVDPRLELVVNRSFGPYPLGWTDFRVKLTIIPALGQLRGPTAKRFLREYVALPEAEARELSPPQYEAATRALLRQDLTRAEIEALLRSPNPAVRGTAILECLDRPTAARAAALRRAASWAASLPAARLP